MKTFFDFGVDGKMLIKLNDEDFRNLDVVSVIHKKKILVEMERICPVRNRGETEDLDDLYLKRERIRNLQKRSYAVRMIQNLYRRYRGKMMILNIKMMVELNNKKIFMDLMIQNSRGWWTDKKIPAKNIKPYTGVILDEKEEIKRNNEDILIAKKMMKKKAFIAIEDEKVKIGNDNQLLVLHRNNSIRSILSDKKFTSILIESKEKTTNQNENHSDTESITTFSHENYSLESDPFLPTPLTNTNMNVSVNNSISPVSSEYPNSQSLHSNNQIKNVLFYIGTDLHVNRSKYAAIKLPEIKTFGRKCDHMRGTSSVKYDNCGEWKPSVGDRVNADNTLVRLTDSQLYIEKANFNRIKDHTTVASSIGRNKSDLNVTANVDRNVAPFICSGDISHNASLSITQQLRTSGYDKRRLEIFMKSRHN